MDTLTVVLFLFKPRPQLTTDGSIEVVQTRLLRKSVCKYGYTESGAALTSTTTINQAQMGGGRDQLLVFFGLRPEWRIQEFLQKDDSLEIFFGPRRALTKL